MAVTLFLTLLVYQLILSYIQRFPEPHHLVSKTCETMLNLTGNYKAKPNIQKY